MGSDDGAKKKSKRKGRFVRGLVIGVGSVGLLVWILPSPERLLTPSFGTNLTAVPKQCRAKAQSIYQCQAAAATTTTWVMACHRKWCDASSSWFGHCEPCGGIGDRTRLLISQVQDNAQCHARIKIDHPMQDMALWEEAIYEDRYGWLAQLFRFRSYNVKARMPAGAQLLQQHDEATATRTIYTHFKPEGGYRPNEFDACYFHAFFRPTASLQRDIDFHNDRIGRYSIGLHYRTGDASAFSIDNSDTRVRQDRVVKGFEKMMQCANQLAQKLFPEASLEQVTYYLATDNAELKAHVQGEQSTTIYTTDFSPNSYLRGLSEDRNAWLEIFLLASREGLVVNVLPEHGYRGRAKRTSQFAVVAQAIGFIPDDHVQECDVS